MWESKFTHCRENTYPSSLGLDKAVLGTHERAYVCLCTTSLFLITHKVMVGNVYCMTIGEAGEWDTSQRRKSTECSAPPVKGPMSPVESPTTSMRNAMPPVQTLMTSATCSVSHGRSHATSVNSPVPPVKSPTTSVNHPICPGKRNMTLVKSSVPTTKSPKSKRPQPPMPKVKNLLSPLKSPESRAKSPLPRVRNAVHQKRSPGFLANKRKLLVCRAKGPLSSLKGPFSQFKSPMIEDKIPQPPVKSPVPEGKCSVTRLRIPVSQTEKDSCLQFLKSEYFRASRHVMAMPQRKGIDPKHVPSIWDENGAELSSKPGVSVIPRPPRSKAEVSVRFAYAIGLVLEEVSRPNAADNHESCNMDSKERSGIFKPQIARPKISRPQFDHFPRLKIRTCTRQQSAKLPKTVLLCKNNPKGRTLSPNSACCRRQPAPPFTDKRDKRLTRERHGYNHLPVVNEDGFDYSLKESDLSDTDSSSDREHPSPVSHASGGSRDSNSRLFLNMSPPLSPFSDLLPIMSGREDRLTEQTLNTGSTSERSLLETSCESENDPVTENGGSSGTSCELTSPDSKDSVFVECVGSNDGVLGRDVHSKGSVLGKHVYKKDRVFRKNDDKRQILLGNSGSEKKGLLEKSTEIRDRLCKMSNDEIDSFWSATEDSQDTVYQPVEGLTDSNLCKLLDLTPSTSLQSLGRSCSSSGDYRYSPSVSASRSETSDGAPGPPGRGHSDTTYLLHKRAGLRNSSDDQVYSDSQLPCWVYNAQCSTCRGGREESCEDPRSGRYAHRLSQSCPSLPHAQNVCVGTVDFSDVLQHGVAASAERNFATLDENYRNMFREHREKAQDNTNSNRSRLSAHSDTSITTSAMPKSYSRKEKPFSSKVAGKQKVVCGSNNSSVRGVLHRRTHWDHLIRQVYDPCNKSLEGVGYHRKAVAGKGRQSRLRPLALLRNMLAALPSPRTKASSSCACKDKSQSHSIVDRDDPSGPYVGKSLKKPLDAAVNPKKSVPRPPPVTADNKSVALAPVSPLSLTSSGVRCSTGVVVASQRSSMLQTLSQPAELRMTQPSLPVIVPKDKVWSKPPIPPSSMRPAGRSVSLVSMCANRQLQADTSWAVNR